MESCCGRFIHGGLVPGTALELMRSRYTAFSLREVGYLIETHDPQTAGDVDPESVARWAKDATFTRLVIVEVEDGGEDDDEGIVEFKAHYVERSAARIHHERSFFMRIDGRWFYVRPLHTAQSGSQLRAGTKDRKK